MPTHEIYYPKKDSPTPPTFVAYGFFHPNPGTISARLERDGVTVVGTTVRGGCGWAVRFVGVSPGVYRLTVSTRDGEIFGLCGVIVGEQARRADYGILSIDFPPENEHDVFSHTNLSTNGSRAENTTVTSATLSYSIPSGTKTLTGTITHEGDSWTALFGCTAEECTGEKYATLVVTDSANTTRTRHFWLID